MARHRSYKNVMFSINSERIHDFLGEYQLDKGCGGWAGAGGNTNLVFAENCMAEAYMLHVS